MAQKRSKPQALQVDMGTKRKEQQEQGPIKGRFMKLDTKRSALLERARACAALTIPFLLPPEGADENTPLPTPYQGLGARAVNNLAAKLLLALLPPNSPFMRLQLDEELLKKVKKELQKEDIKTLVEEQLAGRERQVTSFIEEKGHRVSVFKLALHLIVTGNALLFIPDDGDIKIYRLDSYVVRRDPMGNVLEIITKELIARDALPLKVQAALAAKFSDKQQEGTQPAVEADEKPLELYTRIVRDGDKVYVTQEVDGIDVLKTLGTEKHVYPVAICPWLALRWTSVDGEDYGRGHVEQYLGDFQALESLSKNILDGAAVASKTIFLVNPNSVTDIDDLIETPNAGFAAGTKDDVHALQVDKYHDLQSATLTAQKLEDRLAAAFLLNSSVQRQAERVTAEEIRYVAQELESSLGGIYSILAIEFQYPYAIRVMAVMQKQRRLGPLPSGVNPIITTGMEALGRGHDLNKLLTFMDICQKGGEQAMAAVNWADFFTRVATGLGMELGALIKSPEQMAAEQQQSMMANMAQGAAPGVAQEVVKGAMQQGIQPAQQ